MTERPIIFSAPMVRAILEGRKTQTRRLIKDVTKLKVTLPQYVRGDWPIGHRLIAQPGVHAAHVNQLGAVSVATAEGLLGLKPTEFEWVCPYGGSRDRLWVKESWTGCWHGPAANGMHLHYAADGSERITIAPEAYVLPKAAANPTNWVTPLFMPRWASRITLEITDVRVQRLQEISEDDAVAEGAESWQFGPEQCLTSGERGALTPYRSGFACLWDEINADRATWKSNPWVWALSFKRVEEGAA